MSVKLVIDRTGASKSGIYYAKKYNGSWVGRNEDLKGKNSKRRENCIKTG